MKFVSCFLLLSSGGVAFGSNVRGAEQEHERSPTRGLQDAKADPASGAVIDDLYEKLGGDVYDQFLETFYQLKMEIESTILEVNPDLDADGVADVARKFIDLLDGDADDEDNASDAGSPDAADEVSDEPAGGEDAVPGPPPEGDVATGSSLEKVDDAPGGNSGAQRGRTSFYKHYNKGCRNKHGGKGSRYYDYDLYRHVSHSYCRSKCSGLGHRCHGYEYSKGKKCEVWRVPIRYVQHVRGLDCYKKN